MKQTSSSGQNANGKRTRGRFGTRGNGSSKFSNQNFESGSSSQDNRDNRGRGNAKQVMEKYLTLAREAQAGGDRVTAEGYMQHAEHYYRLSHSHDNDHEENSEQRQQRTQGRRGMRRRGPRQNVEGTTDTINIESLDTADNTASLQLVSNPPEEVPSPTVEEAPQE